MRAKAAPYVKARRNSAASAALASVTADAAAAHQERSSRSKHTSKARKQRKTRSSSPIRQRSLRSSRARSVGDHSKAKAVRFQPDETKAKTSRSKPSVDVAALVMKETLEELGIADADVDGKHLRRSDGSLKAAALGSRRASKPNIKTQVGRRRSWPSTETPIAVANHQETAKAPRCGDSD